MAGPDASLFSLDSSDGQLSVASGAALDYEKPGSYFVTVTAKDPSSNADTITVTISLTNVEEAGTVVFLPHRVPGGRRAPRCGSTIRTEVCAP